MTSSFEQAGAPLAGVAQQPSSLAAAVATGELWMEAGVAETAAARCDKAVKEIDSLLMDARLLARERKFGANDDGNAAAVRFVQAAQDYIDTMLNAGQVFANMAATYRAAGRTVTEGDAVNEQMFRGLST
ncbi:MAG: hypothetical protein ACRDQ4_05330 [Pseudonocardiaceae bacterium]